MNALFMKGRPGRMVGPILVAVLILFSQASAETPYERAVQLYQSGDFQQAREQFTLLLEQDPDDPDVLFYMAELESDADAALDYRQRLLSSHPDHRRADQVLYGIAQYHFAVGYYLTAAKDYQRLLNEYQDSGLQADAQYWLASSKLAIGAADSAAVYFRQLIQNHPESSLTVWAELGLIDALYIKQEYAAAQRRSQEFLQARSGSELTPVALFRLFEIREARGEREAAAEILQQLVKSHPDTYQGKQAQRQLTEWGWDDAGRPVETQPAEGNYTIQVGAFSKRSNGLSLQSQLSSWGYQVEMIKRAGRHRTLYLVWVGRYQTREEALREAEKLERDRGLPYQVIRR